MTATPSVRELIETFPFRMRGERHARAIVARQHPDPLVFTWREGGRWHIGGHCDRCGWSRPADPPAPATYEEGADV